MNKIVKVALLFLFLILSVVSPVLAVDTPNFPACVSAQGTVIANYPSGTHGIVGDSRTYTGSDKVFSISETTLVQCFCSQDGAGIQTNWWKISSLDEEQLSELKAQGWIYVPTGAVWGLDDTAYMAKNANYSCNPGTSDVCPNLDGIQTSLPNEYHFDNDGINCLKYEYGGPGKSTGTGGGGQVLGLATTGTTSKMLAFGGLGSLILAITMMIDKSRKNVE